MKKIYSFIFTLLFKHFLRVTAKEENKTTWQTNLYYMYFCRKCLYFTSFLFKKKKKKENRKKKKAGALIKCCLTCDIRVGCSKDMELPLCEKLENSGKAALKKVWKASNCYSQTWQEQQLAGWRGEDSSSDHHLTVLSNSIHSSGGTHSWETIEGAGPVCIFKWE